MVYKQHNMGSYTIHTIKTDRFKNIGIEVVFRNNVDPKRCALRTCLFDVLLENNLEYKTKRDMILMQEELYNSLLYSVTYKVGATAISSVVLDMLNPKYADYNYLDDAIKYLFTAIFNPNITNNEFDEQTLNTVKNRLIADIKTVKENPTKHALQNALKVMDEESLSALNIAGTVETVEAITPSKLYEEYKEVLEHDYIDIYVIGDFNENEVIDSISNYAKFNTIKTHEVEINNINKTRKKAIEQRDESNNAQSQVVLIYNTNDLTDYEKKYTFQIYNMVLGGGSLETKLYHKLRDENSLCYSLRSMYQKYDDLLIIGTSVDKSNVSLAIKLIKETIKEMLTEVTDEEIATAVNSKISAINMAFDEPGRIIDEYLFRNISDLDDAETRIEEYKNITKEMVMNVAKKISLNTIYVLEGGDSNEEN